MSTKYWDWLSSLLHSDGSVIKHTAPAAYVEDDAYFTIEPYFASMSMWFAYRATPELAGPAAKAWIHWWWSHRDEQRGTALVHYCTLDRAVTATSVDGSSLPSEHEDATDSNIAMWFLLLDAIIEREGVDWIAYEIRDDVAEVLNALVPLVDTADGLTWARADWRLKYLMDNVEVLVGLRAAERVLKRFGSSYDALASAWAKDIEASLPSYWDKASSTWAVHKTDAGQFAKADLNEPYPGANAQVWPSLFGVDPRGGLNVVRNKHMSWASSRIGNTTADIHLALAAIDGGRVNEAQAWMERIASTFEDGESFVGDFTAAEAAQLHYIATKLGA